MKRPAGIHFPLFLMIDIEVEEKVPFFFLFFLGRLTRPKRRTLFNLYIFFPLFSFRPKGILLVKSLAIHIYFFFYFIEKKEKTALRRRNFDFSDIPRDKFHK